MNPSDSSTDNPSAEALRERMLEQIKAAGHARSTPVEAVMRAVPRHRFVPDASVEDAYADIAIITKRADDGTALSCASVPTIVAMMLDQLEVRPGDRILEIGAGTGYNAALLSDLAGPDGHVTTVDVDAEVTAGARRNLDANGYHQVEVVTGDGADGAAQNAPYDRIVFTVGAWDLPPAVWEQLKEGGRLVVPLRWRGQTRSLSLVRHGDQLIADSVELCGFVPMVGQEGEKSGHLDPDGQVALHWDLDQDIRLNALRDVLDRPKVEVWSGVTVGPYDPFDGLWLQMTATEPNVCRIAATAAAVEAGLCTPAIPTRSPAIVDHDSLAYFTLRRLPSEGESRYELGAIAHGPNGHQLGEQLCERIREWAEAPSATPAITAHRLGDPTEADTGHAVRKQCCTLELTAPTNSEDMA